MGLCFCLATIACSNLEKTARAESSREDSAEKGKRNRKKEEETTNVETSPNAHKQSSNGEVNAELDKKKCASLFLPFPFPFPVSPALPFSLFLPFPSWFSVSIRHHYDELDGYLSTARLLRTCTRTNTQTHSTRSDKKSVHQDKQFVFSPAIFALICVLSVSHRRELMNFSFFARIHHRLPVRFSPVVLRID